MHLFFLVMQSHTVYTKQQQQQQIPVFVFLSSRLQTVFDESD